MSNNSSTKKSAKRAQGRQSKNARENNSRPSSSRPRRSRQDGKGGAQRQVGASSAYSSQQIGKAPVIVASSSKCVVRHRELISSIVGSSNFSVAEKFPLNPGMSATFPWLSNMAKSWEKYHFKKLKFQYFTRTGTATAGSMMMVPDFDPADTEPATEQIASSYSGVVEDAPWKDMMCVLPESMLHEKSAPKFIRTAALSANLDIKTYDAGNLWICVLDGASTAWGKLWVEYEVEFSIPCIPPAGFGVGGLINGGGTMSPTNPFGTTPVVDPEAVGLSIEVLAQDEINFVEPGYYLIVFSIVGTVLTTTFPTITPVNHISYPTNLSTVTVNSAATNSKAIMAINVVTPNSTVIVDMTACATTITALRLWATPAPFDSL